MEFTKVRDVKSPTRGTNESAGIDFYVPNDYNEFTIKPGESVLIPSGIKIKLFYGQVGLFLNKSGVGVKGVLVGAQVVDSDYRGEVHLNVHNVSNKELTFKPGQKLVQMLIMDVKLPIPFELTNESYSLYEDTERGSGGFGSTGA
jgi:dUTP pyrophosphatase